MKNIIGVVKCDFGNKYEGIELLKEVEEIFLDGRVKNIFKFNSPEMNLDMLHDIRYALAYANFDLEKYEEALTYINQVGEFATKKNEEEYFENYLGLKGAILIKKGDYSEGLNLTNAYLYNSRVNEADELSHSYAIQGIAYDGLGLIQQSVVAFKNSDSLHQASGADYFFPELKTTFSKLYDYHTSTDNTEKQIEYLNKIIAYEEHMATFKNEIGRKVEQNYSIPELIADRDALIAGLEKKNSLKTMWTILASIIGGICLLVAIFQFKKRLLVRKRFEELSADLSLKKNRTKNVRSTKNKNAALAQLDARQIESIALSLETFENKKGFLKNNITLQSLAQDLGTNSSYLSKYINAIKAENFSTYLSNLRIHYVLDELYESKILRSYTIQAIAREIGFTTAKSFSSHFKRVTGMTVSYFLKNIELEKSASKEDTKLKAVVTMKDSISKVS